jgi:sulfopyruvate decarboxylase TPP-binding subunit
LELKQANIPLGKATKKILENPELDPAYRMGEKKFVVDAIKEVKNEL